MRFMNVVQVYPGFSVYVGTWVCVVVVEVLFCVFDAGIMTEA